MTAINTIVFMTILKSGFRLFVQLLIPEKIMPIMSAHNAPIKNFNHIV